MPGATDWMDARLAKREVLILDGGMGSELQARGVRMDHEAWCGLANIEQWESVKKVHEDYIQAGADILIANTYPCAPFVFEMAGCPELFEEANRKGIEAALEARYAAADRPVLIAGSISSYGLSWAVEKGLQGSSRDLLESYRAQASVLASAGAELIVLEMIHPSWAEGLQAATETGLPIWLAPIVGLAQDNSVFVREPFEEPPPTGDLKQALADLMHPNVSAVTVMHSDVHVIGAGLDEIAQHWHGPIGAYPHVGEFRRPEWIFTDITPDAFAEMAASWVDHGAQLVGGCCGIRPEHIDLLKKRLPTHLPDNSR